MHQVATISVQLELGSTLVECYRDATSGPSDHLLIDLSPRTADRLPYCTKTGNTPSKFYVPDNLKHLKHLDDEHTKSRYSPIIPSPFPRMQNSVPKNLSQGDYPIFQPANRQLAAKKLLRSEKKSRAKIQRRNSRAFFRKNNLEATKKLLLSQKRLLLIKKFSHFVIIYLP